MPLVDWGLMVLVIALAIGFRSSGNLAAAYGIAVTGTMFITACMLGVLTYAVWKWPPILAGLVTAAFLVIDGLYFASNMTKVPDGGWFPLLVAAIASTLLTTWAKGRRIMRAALDDKALSLELFAKSACKSLERVPGTAVFLSSTKEGVPPALMHNVKHNKVLHARVIIATVAIGKIPHVPEERRLEVGATGDGFYRATIHYGFMDEIDVPAALSREESWGDKLKPMDTSYFLGRQTLIPSSKPGMAIWREKLFAWMVQNAESAMDFFKLPINRVVELGSRLEI